MAWAVARLEAVSVLLRLLSEEDVVVRSYTTFRGEEQINHLISFDDRHTNETW